MATVLLWFELLSLIVAIINYRYLKGSNLVWFIPFLILTNVQEWGSRFGFYSHNGSNALSLNIFSTLEFLFYSWLFYNEIKIIRFKKIIITTITVLLISIIVNVLFLQGPHIFHTFTFLPGSVLMVSYILLYFYDLFLKDEEVRLIKNPMFWICTGLLFYYPGMFFVYGFFHVVSEEMAIEYGKLFILMANIFNIILYSCFTIAFLCRRWKSIS
jgi:hypothetical protein